MKKDVIKCSVNFWLFSLFLIHGDENLKVNQTLPLQHVARRCVENKKPMSLRELIWRRRLLTANASDWLFHSCDEAESCCTDSWWGPASARLSACGPARGGIPGLFWCICWSVSDWSEEEKSFERATNLEQMLFDLRFVCFVLFLSWVRRDGAD